MELGILSERNPTGESLGGVDWPMDDGLRCSCCRYLFPLDRSKLSKLQVEGDATFYFRVVGVDPEDDTDDGLDQEEALEIIKRTPCRSCLWLLCADLLPLCRRQLP